MKQLSYAFVPGVVMVLTLAAGCTNTAAKDKIHDVKGKVVSVDAEKKTVTLDHEAIPGFMKAMKMPFDVEDGKLLEGLKPGDQVQGKLKSKNGKHTLTELTKQ